MQRCFILGAGFSRAISPQMPLLRDLSLALKGEVASEPGLARLREEPFANIIEDFELLLTYLSQRLPWKNDAETHEELGLFFRIAEWLTQHITKSEERVLAQGFPDWAIRLVRWLHEAKFSVVSFNYDTILERIAEKVWQALPEEERPSLVDLYGIPLVHIAARDGTGVWGDSPKTTFHLVKLHGSINWYYSGQVSFPSEPVYYLPLGQDDRRWIVEARLTEGLVPLIVPPVAEKTGFYKNLILRSLWRAARQYLESAQEIYCVGYSIPETDLTFRLLLQSLRGSYKKVYIVNLRKDDEEVRELTKRYKRAFPKAEISGRYIVEKPLEKLVEDLCSPQK